MDVRALPAVTDLLAAAVSGIGGAERPGQVAMAGAVERSIRSGEHLAVQAGTGTGKSLAYLVPAIAHALASGSAVVVATATIALQRQLIDRDLPRLAATLKPLLGREPEFAILKGRRNYLCLHRLKSGAPEDPRDVLFDRGPTSPVGQQVERVHAWVIVLPTYGVETQSTGSAMATVAELAGPCTPGWSPTPAGSGCSTGTRPPG